MSLSDYKVTPEKVAQKGVAAEPGTRLTGTAAENKAVFDRLVREIVADCINSIIEALSGTGGAGEIGTTDTGMTVQGSLNAKAGAAAMELALEAKADKAETAGHIKAVTFDETTGVLTFTKQDDSTITVDTLLEKVVTNWAYDSSSQSLVLTLADGTTQSVSLSAFITETEFQDSDQIDFSVANHVVTATIKSGSITDTMLASQLRNLLEGYVLAAKGSAEIAEAWATGEIDGSSASEPMKSSNAKHFKDLAETWAVGTADGQPVTPANPGDPGTGNNAKYWSDQAAATALSFRTFSGSSTDAGQDRTVILTEESAGRFDELKEGDAFFVWMADPPTGSTRICIKKGDEDSGTAWIDLYGNYAAGEGAEILPDQWRSGSVIGFAYHEVRASGEIQHREFLMLNESTAGLTNYGVTRLSSNLDDESEMLAATPKAVKTTHDRALGAYSLKTASGQPAVITDGADGLPVKALSVAVNAQQSGSGAPSPDNPRPFAMISQAVIQRYGTDASDRNVTVTVDLGGQRSMATLDVTNGVLTVLGGVYSLGNAAWQYQSSYQRFVAYNYDAVVKRPASNNTALSGVRISHYANASANMTASGGNNLLAVGANGEVFIRDTRFTDAAALKSWLSGNTVQAVFPLANTTTVQLTAAEVTTLLGENHIVCDAGEVTVTYRRDPTLALQELEEAMVALGGNV